MKINDIIEYSMQDEPVYGTSRAAVRQQTANYTNATRRSNNRARNANDEANVKAQQQYHSQKRNARRVPTGIPARAMTPQAPRGNQQ
jgi:hypothetical protein